MWGSFGRPAYFFECIGDILVFSVIDVTFLTKGGDDMHKKSFPVELNESDKYEEISLEELVIKYLDQKHRSGK